MEQATMEGLVGDLKGVKGEMGNLATLVSEGLKQQDAEIKKHGKATEETGKRMDALNELWVKNESNQADIKAALAELALKQGRMAANGRVTTSGREISLGKQFVQSKGFAAMVKGSRSAADAFDVSEAFRNSMSGDGLKAAEHMAEMARKDIPITSAEAGALVDEFRWDQVIQDPLRPPRVVDLIPSISVNSNAVEFPRENITHELYTELTTQADATDTTAVVERTSGMYVNAEDAQQLTFSPGLAQEETVTVTDVNADGVTVTFTPALANTHPIGRAVTSETFVFTAEAQLKPFARLEWDLVTTAIKTLATMMPISNQMLEDFAAVSGLIDARLREFLELSKETQVLFGDGTTNQIKGILSDPDILSYAWSDGQVGDTKLDAIRRAFTGVFLSFFPVDAIVLHPSDWEDIELLKGTDGQYIFNQAPTAGVAPRIWRANVVSTPVIGVGRALAGAFRLGAVLWNRNEVKMKLSDQNRDWFEKNLTGVRLEERMAVDVLRPKSFVDIDFDGAPS
jgi:hypothetical protein